MQMPSDSKTPPPSRWLGGKASASDLGWFSVFVDDCFPVRILPVI